MEFEKVVSEGGWSVYAWAGSNEHPFDSLKKFGCYMGTVLNHPIDGMTFASQFKRHSFQELQLLTRLLGKYADFLLKQTLVNKVTAAFVVAE